MTLITCQGFDSDSWNVVQWDGWTETGSISASTTGGRRGSGGVAMTAGTAACNYFPASAQTTCTVGAAVKITTLANQVILKLRDNANAADQLSLELQLDGAIELLRGATLLDATAAGVMTAGAWRYLELQVTIDNSIGAYELRVDEVNVMSASGVDTQESASATLDHVQLRYGGTGTIWDDFYMLNASGSVNNDFLGDVMVETLYATGNGTTNAWTPLSGSNFQMVDEPQQDGDTTYVSTSAAGNIDLYAMGNLTDLAGGTVLAVSVATCLRHDSATQTARNVLRTGGSNFEGGDIAVPAAYAYSESIWETNPDTTSAWTESEVNALEAGVKLEAI